jgi:group I intron endonuclease
MIDMGYIYMLTDKRNDKKYVGKHNGNKKEYWSSGLIPNRIAKIHGRSIFDRTILEDNINDLEILNEREMYYIEKYDTFKNGYNATIGGEGGGHWIYNKTEEEKLLIFEKKSKKLTGRVFSDETRKKMSESAKNKKLTDEHKENIRQAVIRRGGTPHTEETKEKLSKLKKGIKNPEHSKFMVENNPNNVKISVDGVIYDSIVGASKELNISKHTIKGRLNSSNEKFKNWIRL